MRRRIGSPALNLKEAEWRAAGLGEPLTDVERIQLAEMRERRDDWHPLAALNYAWDRVDRIHGAGGWRHAGFLAALAADRVEIARVLKTHPKHKPRLRLWLAKMEAFAKGFDEEDPTDAVEVGVRYEELSQLGYRYLPDDERMRTT